MTFETGVTPERFCEPSPSGLRHASASPDQALRRHGKQAELQAADIVAVEQRRSCHMLFVQSLELPYNHELTETGLAARSKLPDSFGCLAQWQVSSSWFRQSPKESPRLRLQAAGSVDVKTVSSRAEGGTGGAGSLLQRAIRRVKDVKLEYFCR